MTGMTFLLNLLHQNAVFAGLPERVLRQLAAAASARSFMAEGALIQQGDPARWFVVLVQGRAKLVQLTPEGRQVLVRYIGAGQEFGLIAALPGLLYPLTVQAIEECRALFWDGQQLAHLMERHGLVALNALRVMVTRNQETQLRYQQLLTERVEQRLARALLRLAQMAGQSVENGTLLALPFTREDLAELTGTTLFTVSRTLAQWEQAGIVEAGRGRIVLCRPDALQPYVSETEVPPLCSICGYLRLRKDEPAVPG